MRPTPKPSFLLSEVDTPTPGRRFVQMVETRGARPSFDGQETSDFPPFPSDGGDIGKCSLQVPHPIVPFTSLDHHPYLLSSPPMDLYMTLESNTYHLNLYRSKSPPFLR
jgi:hypothetical protein